MVQSFLRSRYDQPTAELGGGNDNATDIVWKVLRSMADNARASSSFSKLHHTMRTCRSFGSVPGRAGSYRIAASFRSMGHHQHFESQHCTLHSFPSSFVASELHLTSILLSSATFTIPRTLTITRPAHISYAMRAMTPHPQWQELPRPR
jgi:hypothetical protein